MVKGLEMSTAVLQNDVNVLLLLMLYSFWCCISWLKSKRSWSWWMFAETKPALHPLFEFKAFSNTLIVCVCNSTSAKSSKRQQTLTSCGFVLSSTSIYFSLQQALQPVMVYNEVLVFSCWFWTRWAKQILARSPVKESQKSDLRSAWRFNLLLSWHLVCSPEHD